MMTVDVGVTVTVEVEEDNMVTVAVEVTVDTVVTVEAGVCEVTVEVGDTPDDVEPILWDVVVGGTARTSKKNAPAITTMAMAAIDRIATDRVIQPASCHIACRTSSPADSQFRSSGRPSPPFDGGV